MVLSEEPELVNASRISNKDVCGFSDLYNGAAPVTKGAAMLVPLVSAYVPFADVELILTPGAAISTTEP